MWAAVVNAGRRVGDEDGSARRVVFLTLLGGGAFGNDERWILGAMRRALDRVRDLALDGRIVSYGRRNEAVARLIGKH